MIAALLDHLWQSTVFAAIAGLLALATGNNGARVRFGLWFAASLKFLLPFSLLVTLGSEFLLPHTGPITTSPSAYMAQEAAQPFAVAAFPLSAPQAGFPLLPVLFAIWALGFFTLLLVWFLRWTRLRTVLRSAAQLPMALPMPVKSSAALLEPGLVGIVRPVLLLPAGIAERLTPDEMNAILAHEICHFRRRDNLTAAIHMAVEALFWFYPLVWWLETRLVAERERACDEAVVAAGSTPDAYAEGILKVCRLYVRSPLACAAGVSGADLRKRIETIMANRFILRLGPAKKSLLLGSTAAVLAAPLLMGMAAPPMVTGPEARFAPTVLASPNYIDQMRPRTAISLAPEALEKYAGYYRIAEDSVIEIHRNGAHLFARGTRQHNQEIYPDGEGELFNKQFHIQFTFETDAAGKARTLLLHQSAEIYRAPRMDDGEGARLQTALEQDIIPNRIRRNIRHPGTEESLRRFLLSLERGQPNYQEMGPVIAANVRQEFPAIQARMKNWGPLKSITFERVGPAGGMDFYKVRFANGSAEWGVGPLDPDGRVRGRTKLSTIRFHFGGGWFD